MSKINSTYLGTGNSPAAHFRTVRSFTPIIRAKPIWLNPRSFKRDLNFSADIVEALA